MNFPCWIYPCFLLFAYGCVSVKPENIKYNTAKRHLEFVQNQYVVPLRNSNYQLIDSARMEDFQIELEEMDHHYPFEERLENNDLLRKSDFKMTQLYADINSSIQNKNFSEALNDISNLRHVYPEIDYYSDCSFLEGYVYEKLGQSDSAAIAYHRFYTYSDKKYSRIFRGYRDSDTNDVMYIAEKNHAYNFMNQIPDSLDENVIHPITAKYYYTSCQPGFIINPEDYSKNTHNLTSFFLGWDLSGDLSAGCQLSFFLNDTINLNTMVYCSRNTCGFGVSAPIQLYTSDSNNFGIKLSPNITLDFLDSLKIDGQYYLADSRFLNFGAKISAAYFFNQKLWLGTSYQYNFFNEKNKYLTRKSNMAVWYNNDFDLSAYYNIIRNLSLKVGVKNADIVAGIYIGGMEISYNITNPGLILRTDIF